MARPGLGTRCVQAGYSPKNGEPRQIPIIQSTTFKYESSAEMGKLFDLEASGYFYSRLQNPTNDAVAARIAALEGGTAAMLTGSGMSAIFFSIFNIVGAGDHLVSSSSIYGGSFNLFSVTMKRMGVEVTFVDPDCSPEELDAAFRPNTKAMYGETIANPALTVLDIEKFAAAAHRHGVPLILDNTFATPINCRPFEWGADIVVHSTTKYMDGHAGALGGAIVDSGRFDWTKYPDKYPGLCTPDESYHGVTYTERFGLAGAYITKATVQLMRDLGAVQSPQNAYYLNLGLESLHVRMQRHCENAQRVAEFLQRHENVSWVQYCGLPGDKYYELGQKYLPNGSCGVVSFGVRGGRAAAEAVMSKLQVAAIETHVADSHTCCLHPASTTHRQMNAEELLAAGVREDLIRYSCGLDSRAEGIPRGGDDLKLPAVGLADLLGDHDVVAVGVGTGDVGDGNGAVGIVHLGPVVGGVGTFHADGQNAVFHAGGGGICGLGGFGVFGRCGGLGGCGGGGGGAGAGGHAQQHQGCKDEGKDSSHCFHSPFVFYFPRQASQKQQKSGSLL